MYVIRYKHTYEDSRRAVLTAGYTEDPSWVRKGPDGQPEPCEEALATAIRYKGTVYNLPGHNDFDGAETGAAEQTDSGELLSDIPDMAQADDDRDELLVDIEYRVTLLELGLDPEELEDETDALEETEEMEGTENAVSDTEAAD